MYLFFYKTPKVQKEPDNVLNGFLLNKVINNNSNNYPNNASNRDFNF